MTQRFIESCFSCFNSYGILKTALIVFLSLNIIAIAQEEKKTEKWEDHYHLSAFVGYSMDLKGKTGPKLGIEYEYQFSKKLGVGGTFDFTGKDFKIFSFSVGADFFPFEIPLVLGVALGAKHQKSKWKPFVRGVAVYDFHIGKFSYGPILMYDVYFNNKNIISPGLTFGISL